MGAVKKSETTQGKTDRAVDFLRGVWSELKKVHWPGRRQLIAYTGVVLIAVLFVALLLWIVDSGLSAIMAKLLAL